MIGDNKDIIAGDGSTNIQGNKVTVNQQNGLDYTQVRQVAMDVFKSNFYDLGEKASKIARERAEEVTNSFLEKLEKESPHLIKNTEDPDIRYALFEVQKSHARLGDKEMCDLLVNVLLQRTTNQNDSFIKLVLNEALTVIPKLTSVQIDVLTLIFLFRSMNFIKPVPFDAFYGIVTGIIKSEDIPLGEMCYQHLQYTGCLSISIGSLTSESFVKAKSPQFIEEDLNGNINFASNFQGYLTKWDNSKLCHASLTSVGMAIAISNLNKRIGMDLSMGVWINE